MVGAKMNIQYSIGPISYEGEMQVRARDHADSCKKNNSVIQQVLMRGRGGQLLPVEHGKLAMMRGPEDAKLTIPQRFELVSKRAEGISSLIDYPLPELSLLGERSLFRHEGKLFEAVLLKGNQEVMRMINEPVRLEGIGVNKHEAVVGINYVGINYVGINYTIATVIAGKINEELRLGLKLPEASVARTFAESEGQLLRALEISSFWTSTLNEEGDMPLLQSCNYPSTSKPYNPQETANEYIGIVLGRAVAA